VEGAVLEIENLSAGFDGKDVVKGVSLEIPANKVTAIMGPSGCGKTTFIRCINRMHELAANAHVTGTVLLDGEDVYRMNPILLRRRIGMVFQRPNPFPKSVSDNVAFGPRAHGLRNRRRLTEIVEHSLRSAALWDEVKDQLDKPALSLSPGQQQRLCIARALAVEPEVILMDEPASALDPLATLRIEELMESLKAEYTIVIVTHNMQQAARASDYTAFFNMLESRAGSLVEYGPTRQIFTNPRQKSTEDYITGRFG